MGMGHGVRYLCPMPETASRRFLPPLQGVGFLAVFFKLHGYVYGYILDKDRKADEQPIRSALNHRDTINLHQNILRQT